MAAPSISIDRILAAVPTTTRGQATQLSADAKGQRIAYAVRRRPFPSCLPALPCPLTDLPALGATY